MVLSLPQACVAPLGYKPTHVAFGLGLQLPVPTVCGERFRPVGYAARSMEGLYSRLVLPYLVIVYIYLVPFLL